MLDQFGHANSNEYQRPVLSNDVKDIKTSKIMKQNRTPIAIRMNGPAMEPAFP